MKHALQIALLGLFASARYHPPYMLKIAMTTTVTSAMSATTAMIVTTAAATATVVTPIATAVMLMAINKLRAAATGAVPLIAA